MIMKMNMKSLYRLPSKLLLSTHKFSYNKCHTSSKIKKVLIANRGEIACRVIRTAHKMGIQSVCLFSEVDRNSLHVAMADEAYCIGPPAVQESYLRKDKVLDVARRSGADAIHPGYGFLSESTEFAELCEKERIIFIGPPSSAIRDMGIKSTSKQIMSAAGVPVVGGYHGSEQETQKMLEEAKRIGFPVMIKAVRGGGGKGMRISMTESDFIDQLNSAKTEALKSFGDEVMLIEKYVQRPRHVEVQVFGDKHGNYVHLFERDCSVQRRHQKIIEEAPAPGVTPEIRKRLGDAAVRAAKAVEYVGAGTVEFILDTNFEFYFMEMNTRLQVEHPVTEMITDTDLVEWQIRVAAGERLPVSQEELSLRGHSFEARIYAEDPNNNFLPGAGTLHRMVTPSPEKYIRIETGVREGDDVSVHYDPMIAKLVVWGNDRETALSRLLSSLSEFNVVGLNTNIDFLMSLAQHSQFRMGDVHTDFIPQHHSELFAKSETPTSAICKAAVAIILGEEAEALRKASSSLDPTSPFRPGVTPRFNYHLVRELTFNHQDKDWDLRVTYCNKGEYRVTVDGRDHLVSGRMIRIQGVDYLTASIEGDISSQRIILHNSAIYIFSKSGQLAFIQPEPKYKAALSGGVASKGEGVAPMPGVIEKLCVKEGQEVSPGDPLAVLMAMKMEYVIKAQRKGVVEKINHFPGESVAKDTVLVKIGVLEEK